MAELKEYRQNSNDSFSNVNGVAANSTPADVHQIGMKDLSEDKDYKKGSAMAVSPNHEPAVSSKLIDKGESSNNKDEKKKEEKVDMVRVFELFRFSTGLDRFLMAIGTLAAIIHGAALPGMIIVFGQMIDLFINSGEADNFLNSISSFLKSINMTKADFKANSKLLLNYCGNITEFYKNKENITCTDMEEALKNIIMDQMTTYAIYYVIIGGGVIIVGYLHVSCWVTAAERQTHRIRVKFFHNILRQEIGWFDTHESGELNTRLADDIGKIHDGIGDKVGNFVQWFSCFLTGFIVGFYYGWKLTLVILAVSPALAIAAGLMSKLAASMTSKELQAYAKAGAIAEEVLGSIRTVAAFGGEKKESERYNGNLSEAKAFGIRKGLTSGLSMGFVWLVIFASYALGFWYGSKLTRDEPDTYSPGNMLIVFFSVLIGAFSLGNAAPSLQSLSVARGAAYVIFQIIDLVPHIDSDSDEGKKPQAVIGNIEFRKVHFCYPSRPEVKVLNGIDLDVKPGQTVALVGASGCGKSTTVQLLQRFYDPESGSIMLDGNDIRELSVQWLRKHIGIVSQEPVLFGTTIKENIRYGRDGVTDDEIIQAAKMANAHDYISKLPDKYETLVGERGAQLSGGQKQRVAIARALVRDPKILLLDEATSALDTESESIVQDALDHAREGRTTLVIAHRLSTIKNADRIVGFRDGIIAERGTHDELMEKKGIYYELVMNQTKEKKSDDDDEEEEIEMMTRVGSARGSARQLKRLLSQEDKQLNRTRSISQSKEEETKEEENLPKVSVFRIIKLNAPEWHFILLGCMAAILNGGIQPAFSIIFSEILGVYQKTADEQEREVRIYSLVLLGLGVLSCFTNFVQGFMFGLSGETLTLRLRLRAFRSMLRQDISYFDDHKNNTGALTTRLASDASLVQGATGVRLGMVVMNIANMGTAIVIAFYYGWKLTLVIFAFLPFIAIAGAIEMKVLGGVAGKNKEALEGAGKIAIESIENIRTVASLSKEPHFNFLYLNQLLGPYKQALRKAHLIGGSFGVSQAIIFFAYAASFWFGAWLIKEGEMNYVDVFKVFGAIVFGAMALGQASAFAPDAAKAAVSAARIINLLEKIPSIDSESTEGQKPKDNEFTSKVTFTNVEFRYPTRPDVTVLQGLNISVEPGQTVALVGSSGCGKSTAVQLIERFYDPEAGSVNLDTFSLKELNIQWLRSQIGIVSQEPVLFDRSIAENIAYGDNSRLVPMDEIIEAARNANIHSFIESLPMGYETNVGDKGAQLSGGQKQRVAIARALVRNPKILLLDEATSALDTESEKVVQEALDKAREGRTSIVIAHRLSTIQNADKIIVIRHGKVTEEGKHSELIAKQGFYYKLHQVQNKKRDQ